MREMRYIYRQRTQKMKAGIDFGVVIAINSRDGALNIK